MSANISPSYGQIQKKFIQLSQRERLLILVTGLVAILMVGFLWVIEPMILETQNAQKEAARLKAQTLTLDSKIDRVQIDLQQDINKSLTFRIEANKKEIAKFDEMLFGHTEDLVPANKMPDLLERMLIKSDKLILREMRSIAPTTLIEIEDNGSSQTNLYQHGVQLTLEGQYFDIQRYLEEVEAMPWRFYWKKFSYRVMEYPQAEVEIELYTLSTSPAFIGVWNDG